MFGRLLAGIATSLLFSVFESWMVYEHNKAGYQQEQLSRTFALATVGNGVVAILSGVVANVLRDFWGPVAPFMGALAVLIIAMFLISTTWTENYGDSSRSVFEGFSDAFVRMKSNRNILLVGAIQSLFEGSMYTFVFLWVPALQTASELEATTLGVKPAVVPFGYVFATFMVSVMIGSALFRYLLKSYSVEQMSVGVFAVSALTMMLPIFFINSVVVLNFAFCVFEMCCGMFWPCFGTLRSKFIPEESRSAIMNYFRIPLNIIVVGVLINVGSLPLTTCFKFVTLLLCSATGLQYYLFRASLHHGYLSTNASSPTIIASEKELEESLLRHPVDRD
jgi:MFS family permease